MDPFPPTEQQLAVIRHRGANLLVFAGPGTGKTETLARRFASLVADDGIPPQQILVLTFSRRAAEEMRDRVLLRLRQRLGTGLAVSELFVKTFHGFCGRLLQGQSGSRETMALLTPVKERLLWRGLMQSGRLALSSFSADVATSSQFATDCLNVIAHLKTRGIDAQQFSTFSDGDPRLRDLSMIFSALEAERQRLGLQDFRDLVNEAVRSLEDIAGPSARWLQSMGFRHVLVDEFQDSDQMQLRLLERIAAVPATAATFCFVGDVNQSIYRFRGATPHNVERARAEFACESLPLKDNRRSAQQILDVANADPKLRAESLTRAADQTKAGSVRLERPRTVDDEIRAVVDAICARIASGVRAHDIAVLLRQTAPYQQLIARELQNAGIPVAAMPAAGFHEDGLIDAVLTALRLLQTPEDAQLWRRLLVNPIIGFHPIEVRYALDLGRRERMSEPRAALNRHLSGGPQSIKTFLKRWDRVAEAARADEPLELLRRAVQELDLLRPVANEHAVPGFHPVASPLRLNALLTAAADYEETSDASATAGAPSRVADFVARLDETVGLLADANEPPPNLIDGVRVMSIHAAKGLEFEFVIIPQLLDGILPARERPNKLISAAAGARLRSRGIDLFSDTVEADQEEHCLFYVALTRAKSEVLATATQVDDEGIPLQVSPFAVAVDPQALGPGREPQAAPVDMSTDATLAGRCADDGTSVSDAASVISPPASNGSSSAASNGPAKPAIALSLSRLSPTNIGRFVRCPRQFFYADVLKLEGKDDDGMQYGSTLHEILRRFHERETNFENVGDPQEAQLRYATALRDLVEQQPHRAADDSPLERFEAEDLTEKLAVYARHLAQEASDHPFSVLACEHPVTSSIGDVVLQGKADRIDRLREGGLVIRDYKSGRKKTSLLDAVTEALGYLDAGHELFGNMPKGLNLQTILYVTGVEQSFGEPVRRLDYIYFRGEKAGDTDIVVDSTPVVAAESESSNGLTRAQIGRVEREIAAGIVAWCSSGSQAVFPTAHDDQPCRYCDYVRICPGPGAVR